MIFEIPGIAQVSVEPLESDWSRWALVRAVLTLNGKHHVLATDHVDEVFTSLLDALNRRVALPIGNRPGTLVLEWSQYVNDLPSEFEEPILGEDAFQKFIVWSGQDNLTAIYSVGEIIYLEVGPLYEWMFKKSDKNLTNIRSFEDYRKQFEPILFVQLDSETLLRWKEQCESVLAMAGE